MLPTITILLKVKANYSNGDKGGTRSVTGGTLVTSISGPRSMGVINVDGPSSMFNHRCIAVGRGVTLSITVVGVDHEFVRSASFSGPSSRYRKVSKRVGHRVSTVATLHSLVIARRLGPTNSRTKRRHGPFDN